MQDSVVRYVGLPRESSCEGVRQSPSFELYCCVCFALRTTCVVLAAMLCMACASSQASLQESPGAGPADSRDVAAAFVGTWELASLSQRLENGQVIYPWGTRPAGQITYDRSGRVIALIMHEERNEAGGEESPAEVQAQFSAYFGTYEVDVRQHVITHRVVGSLSAMRAAGELRREYEFRDGELVLRTPRGATLVWRRVAGSR